MKARTKANRENKLEYYRAFDRARSSDPDRVNARAEYIKTDAGKAAHNAATKKYASNNQKVRYAQSKVAAAVSRGNLIPWEVCFVPECNRKPEAHHPDYDSPLDVVWLCPAHHKETHGIVSELDQ